MWHLCNIELSGRATKFCSKNCNNKYHVSKKRRSLKLELIEAAGGSCVDCGLTGAPYLFDFDHRDPATKSFLVSNGGNGTSIARLREEAAKCDLVCANCHRHRTHIQRCMGCEYCN